MPWLTIYELQRKSKLFPKTTGIVLEGLLKRYELLEGEIDELMKEIAELADVLGLEIEELPKYLPFYTLSAEEIVD